MNRRLWWLLVTAALAVGIATRAAFLWWSPLPATLDGFSYARLASAILSQDTLFVPGMASDELVFSILLATASELTGVRPLYLAQPLVAYLGGASVLSGIVLVRSIAADFGWDERRTFHASVLAALGLAVSGMYLRRTGVPDEEALGLLLLPLVILVAHRVIRTRRLAWAAIFGGLVAIYPPLHNLSSLVAAFTLTGLATLHIVDARDRREVLTALAVVGTFWAYFVAYYAVAARMGLQLTYTGVLRDHLGAFLAWGVVLLVGIIWVRSTSNNAIRLTFGFGVGVWFIAAGVNLFVPVFPGTIETPPLVLGLVALYVVPIAVVIWWVPEAVHQHGETRVVVALLLGPLLLGWFALSTALTPEFFDTVLRVQVHAHIAAFVLAAGAAVTVASRRPAAGRVLVGLLVLATVLSVPFAFVHLDTGTAPRTVHDSEFGAVAFATTGGQFAADHRLSRVGSLYFGVPIKGATGKTYQWLEGGPSPDCLTVAQRSWTTDGAHFYPRSPQTIPSSRLNDWLAQNSVIYTTGGVTETYAVLPGSESRSGC